MTHHIIKDDPYQLWLMPPDIEQTDAPLRTAAMPDGRMLRAWVTRPELSPDLFEYVEDVLHMSRRDARFPSPGELSMPLFHADLALPNLTPRNTWEYMGDPQQLADSLRREEGVIMPASMHQDLHADATLARYGDLHVDHFGAVVQFESVKRDSAALAFAEISETAAAASRTYLPMLHNHHQSLLADLSARRQETSQRQCSPYDLIGSRSAQWVRDNRVRELKAWPGGEHTAGAIAEFDREVAAKQVSPDPEAIADTKEVRMLKENFPHVMSQARIREWSDQNTPTTTSSKKTTALTEADLVAERTQTRANTVDRGIRRQPKQPAPRATHNAENLRHQNRLDTAQQIEHRRRSM